MGGWLWLPLLVLVVAALVVFMLVRPGSSSVANPAVPAAPATAVPTVRSAPATPAPAPAPTVRSTAAGPTAAPTSHAGTPAPSRQVGRTVTVTGVASPLIGGGGMTVVPASGSPAAPAGTVGVTLFGLDSATVDPAGRQVLARAAALIRSSAPAVVTVTGYASRIGEPTDNLALSRRRAVAVAAVLRSALGPDAPRIAVDARGEAGQVAVGTPAAAGVLDRRVVVTTR